MVGYWLHSVWVMMTHNHIVQVAIDDSTKDQFDCWGTISHWGDMQGDKGTTGLY